MRSGCSRWRTALHVIGRVSAFPGHLFDINVTAYQRSPDTLRSGNFNFKIGFVEVKHGIAESPLKCSHDPWLADVSGER